MPLLFCSCLFASKLSIAETHFLSAVLRNLYTFWYIRVIFVIYLQQKKNGELGQLLSEENISNNISVKKAEILYLTRISAFFVFL